MKLPDILLLCFAIGAIWSLATLLLGGLHFGHGHGWHVHSAHGAASSGHGHAAHHSAHANSSWMSALVNPNIFAVFLCWFGGVGYLLTRHSGWLLWVDLTIAVLLGLFGAWLLASFIRFLQLREKPLDPADYQMVGVLGRVSSAIRPDGVGEVIYVRDGARRPVCARSEDGSLIGRDTEVVITRFEKGIASVRTWEAMVTQPEKAGSLGEALQRDTKNVQ